jgi:hypothetical protein
MATKKDALKNFWNLEAQFKHLHENPPAPFNPDYDPKAKDRYRQVTKSMQEDDYYNTHSQEECKAEWHKRYNNLKGL